MAQFSSSLNNPFQVKNIMPDYAKGISVNSGYVSENYGYIAASKQWNGGNGEFKLNGIDFFYGGSVWGVSGFANGQVFLPVSPGDKIQFTNGHAEFYPLKGA